MNREKRNNFPRVTEFALSVGGGMRVQAAKAGRGHAGMLCTPLLTVTSVSGTHHATWFFLITLNYMNIT